MESNNGIRGFYNITETIKSSLLADVNINTVSTGQISDVNLNKQDIFPLGHIIVNGATLEENIIRFQLQIVVADLVIQSKTETIDRFRGNSNEQDILNTQLAVINRLVMNLRKGTLHEDKYQLDADTNPSCEPFYDRFENMLAGWSLSIEVLVWNDINICIND